MHVAAGNSFGGKGRDLAPWETIALGALAGALASVGTTPADVMKTRIMTAAADQAVDPRAIFLGIIRNEGVGELNPLRPPTAAPRRAWVCTGHLQPAAAVVGERLCCAGLQSSTFPLADCQGRMLARRERAACSMQVHYSRVPCSGQRGLRLKGP